ncbi:hypothetical protein QAD02_009346 [Eretmocerus hayati]|uniref:Uncharacterized protein n=1 Tax=Eretmocerus hayati TaxID=131215 RepID=A0ACC2NAB3_9HYME|nr:hypothetical protein QAD02_009346 [Eretmocerus hayati]
MRLYHIVAGILFGGAMMKPTNGGGMGSSHVLFDFTKLDNVDNWIESSDTVRTVGMSKAVLALQKTQVFQRAVFFSLLNPQPNGAGFAGMRIRTSWDLRNFDEFRIRCRGQGENHHYKVVLRHRGQASNDDYEYEHLFDAPMSNTTFSDVVLPLDGFEAYFRGKKVENPEPLDRADITMFGLQIYGGVYSPFKQSGVSALEIEQIEACKRT